MLTAEFRRELSWEKSAKIVRLGVYDVGILIGALFISEKAAKFWPEYELVFLALAFIGWFGIILNRATDWRSIQTIEKELDRDDVKRYV
jgi:hypothetical protein